MSFRSRIAAHSPAQADPKPGGTGRLRRLNSMVQEVLLGEMYVFRVGGGGREGLGAAGDGR